MTGLGFPNDMKPFFADGTAPVFGLWSVPNLGYLSYVVVDDFAVFRQRMAMSAANARWQPDTASLIDPLTDPTTGFHRRMAEVFPPRLRGRWVTGATDRTLGWRAGRGGRDRH